MGYKEKEFINLSCSPYNTFLVENIYVHNCDTAYSLSALDENGKPQYTHLSIEEIISECERLGNKRITFTGGEPLIQKDARSLVSELTKRGYEVNIETNGNVALNIITDEIDSCPIDQSKVILTMDWKSPSSGMREKMLLDNLKHLTKKDVLKFVVGSKEDLDDMKNLLDQNNLNCHIFVSPIFGDIEPEDIVSYILDNNLQQVRVQLQLHKIIWDPAKRGV
jgi:7-carboxy-7-deazaguanine synthase